MFIAAYGWEHALWSGVFYPDDLPPEWRLAYYANEFHAVVVPAQRWQHADAAEARRWAADCGPAFRFFFEPAPAGAIPAAALRQALGAHYGGVIGAGGVPVTRWAGGADPRALRRAIESLPAAGVLLIEGSPPSLAELRTATTLAELLGRCG